MSSGYFSIPRSLTRDPLWIDSPPAYRDVFNIILDHVCFKPQRFDDHGIIIDLLPGQVCASIREITKWCGRFACKNEIERAIKKFSQYGLLRHEVRHKKSIITITHKDTYELILRSSETTNETILRQTRDNLETEKNNENNEKNEKKEKYKKEKILPISSTEEMDETAINQDFSQPKKQHNVYYQNSLELSQFFLELILKEKPNFKKPDLKSWASHIEKMLKLDGRSIDEIKEVMIWINQDSFEFANVMSTQKLRKRFDSLQAKSHSQRGKNEASNANPSKANEQPPAEPKFRGKRHFSV